MEILPSVNRAQRRIVAAEDRRANRRFLGGCGPSCAPKNGFGQYAPVISTMGRMFGNEKVVVAAHSESNAPYITKAAKLAGVTTEALAMVRPEDRFSVLSKVTNPQFAAEVNGVASKMPPTMSPQDRTNFALMIVLIPGVGEAELGQVTHRSDAVSKLTAGIDGAVNKAKGLSGLGIASGGSGAGTSGGTTAAKTRTPSTTKLSFNEIPTGIGIDFQPNDVFFYAAQFANNKDSYTALTDWSNTPPTWIEPLKHNAFRLAAFAVGRLPEMIGPVNNSKAWDFYGNLASQFAGNDLSALGDWAVSPPSWLRSTKEQTFAASLAALIIGFKKFKNVPVCAEAIKNGEDWILEDCETNATKAGDAEARTKKVALVQRAWAKAFPNVFADNCTINYYTRLKYCSESTYVTVMKAKEAAGRPAPTPEELNRNFGDTAVGGALNAAIDFFANLGGKIVEYISVAAEAASRAFCAGFKALMGETVGGIFCAIFDVIFKLISGALKTAFTIVIQALTAVVEFIKELLQLNFVKALTVLFKRVNTIVVLAIGGPLADLLGIPFTKVDAKRLGKPEDSSFEGLGERLTDQDMMFTVNLAFAIINVVLAATATGLSAGAAAAMLKTSIGGLVMVLAPAFGIVFAPQLMKLDKFKDLAKEKVEKGLTMVIKLGAMVVMAILTLKDFVAKVKESVTKYVENMKKKFRAAGGVGEYLQQFGEGVYEVIGTKFNAVFAKLKTWPIKFDEVGKALEDLAKTLPILLIALVDDGEGTLTEIAKEAQALYNEAAKTWQDAKTQWDSISRELTPEQKAQALKGDIDAAVNKAKSDAELAATQAAEAKYRAEINKLKDSLNTANLAVSQAQADAKKARDDARALIDSAKNNVLTSSQQAITSAPKSNFGLIAGLAGLAVVVAVSRSRA